MGGAARPRASCSWRIPRPRPSSSAGCWKAEGFAVSRAGSGEAALEALNGPLPALVIADYHLPGINGDELVRRIRLNVRARALPVLMLTDAEGGADGGDLERRGWRAAPTPTPRNPRGGK